MMDLHRVLPEVFSCKPPERGVDRMTISGCAHEGGCGVTTGSQLIVRKAGRREKIMLLGVKLKKLFHLPTILAVVCLVLVGTAFKAHAQTARLNGHVADSSGAAVSGAEVKVLNTRTDQVQLLHTDQGGRFEAVSLQPSVYGLTVSCAGFKTQQRDGVTLELDTTTTLDVILTTGAVSESVTVTADANQLQPNSADMSTAITEKEYQHLPLVQNNRLRNPASFVYLAPGVQGNIRLDGNEYTGATNVISVNGGPIWDTELLIEGLPGGQTRIVGNYTESSPPVDAVNEFKVTTTLLPADYGHTGFAVGSFGIKSGTNLLHGSIFEYFRNTALDAANWFAKNQGAVLTNPPIHQNEFGGTVSGPIVLPHLYNGRERTFIFFSYVGSRFSGATSYGTSTTPTAQELTVNANGYYDFSDLKTPIYDPATTIANPKGAGFVRTEFPGNLIPASRLDPVAKNILALYPIPKPGATTIGAFEGDEVLKPDTYTAKVDQALTAAQHLSLAFVHTAVPRINIGSAFPIPLASGYHQTVSSYTARVNHTWTIKPTLVNFVNIGYNRFVNPQTPTGTNPNYPGLLGINGLAGGLFPTFGISGYSTFGDITDAKKTENDFYYKDQIYWTLGKHSLRFGGELRAIQYNDYSPATTTGAFTFKTNETGNPQSQSGTGNAFASFLLGQVDAATIAVPFPLDTRKSYVGFFFQDDWKVLPNLTINLGLREEWQNAPHERTTIRASSTSRRPIPVRGIFREHSPSPAQHRTATGSRPSSTPITRPLGRALGSPIRSAQRPSSAAVTASTIRTICPIWISTTRASRRQASSPTPREVCPPSSRLAPEFPALHPAKRSHLAPSTARRVRTTRATSALCLARRITA